MGSVITNPQEWNDYLRLNFGYFGGYERVGQNEGGLSVSGSITTQQILMYGLIGLVAYLALR